MHGQNHFKFKIILQPLFIIIIIVVVVVIINIIIIIIVVVVVIIIIIIINIIFTFSPFILPLFSFPAFISFC